MNKIAYLLLSIGCLTLAACDRGSLKPNSTGAAYELLLVIDDSVFQSAVGDTLRMFLNQDMPCMPQSEPLFNLSRTSKKGFNDLLQPARNILMVHVGDRYTSVKIKKAHDRWSKPQAIIVAQGPDIPSIANALGKHQDAIVDFFVEAEHKNAIAYQKKSPEATMQEKVKKSLGVEITIPKGLIRSMQGENFLWLANNNLNERQNILIYTTPYPKDGHLTAERQLALRDSVLKANIPGPTEGSYMATEYRIEPPIARVVELEGKQDGLEIRGLWRVEGNYMGGPFVSMSTLDKQHRRVITAEVFIYAPNKYKRNLLRRLEANLYTLKPYGKD